MTDQEYGDWKLKKLMRVWSKTTQPGGVSWPVWMAQRIDMLELALAEVEFSDTLEGLCCWCGRNENSGHKPDCNRQKALESVGHD